MSPVSNGRHVAITIPPPPPPPPPAGVHRATPIASYEAGLLLARWSARTVGALFALSKFIAWCSLTWATVVLLGAFVSYLRPLDFGLVSALLFLEAVRLASTSFFTRLLTHALARLSQDPKYIQHGKDIHHQRARRARFLSHILQFVFISPSFMLPIWRLLSLHIVYSIEQKVRNLLNSIFIFYTLIAINALISFINLICSSIVFAYLSKTPEKSILRYYDKVLENTMSAGIVQADEFVFFHFAYELLAGEFERNVQPEAVAKNHKELIRYLYMHRHGLDFMQIYLDSSDAFTQTAAANMVGMWADPDWGLGLDVKLPEELLTKIADKMGKGQVGWAAANSIGRLARTITGVKVMAETVTSRGRRLADRLADLVDVSSSRSLVFVRTLVFFYQQLSSGKQNRPDDAFEKPENLVTKLKELLKGSKIHRLRVQSAYLLLMMGELGSEEAKHVEAIKPTQDSYWFRSEVSMLELLLSHKIGAGSSFPELPSLRQDALITPPPWAHPPPPNP